MTALARNPVQLWERPTFAAARVAVGTPHGVVTPNRLAQLEATTADYVGVSLTRLRSELMKPGILARTAVVTVTLGAAGCGSAADTALVSLPSPFIAQVEGQWSGTARLRSADGTLTSLGECVQADVNSRIASGAMPEESIALSATQDAEQVAARLMSNGTGMACSYKGRLSLNTVVLDSSACEAPLIVVRCSNNEARDLKLVGSTIRGDVNVQTREITGTVTNSYNVFKTSTTEGIAGVTFTYDYTIRKR